MSSDEDQKSDEESLGEQLYQEALKDTAGDLHVDLIHEPHLVHYVELALHSSPPDGWEERVDETLDGIPFTYFLHTSTQERSRTNPSFQTFEDQIQRARLSHRLSSDNNEFHSIDRQDSMIMAAMQGIPGLLPTDEEEEGKGEEKENEEGNEEENKEEDKIEKVLARRLLKNGKTEYKVHWLGTRSNEDEWFLHSKLVGDARLKQMLDTFDSLHQTIENVSPCGENCSEIKSKANATSSSTTTTLVALDQLSENLKDQEIQTLRRQLEKRDVDVNRLQRKLREINIDRTSLQRSMELLLSNTALVRTQLEEEAEENMALRHRLRCLQSDTEEAHKQAEWKESVAQLLKSVDRKTREQYGVKEQDRKNLHSQRIERQIDQEKERRRDRRSLHEQRAEQQRGEQQHMELTSSSSSSSSTPSLFTPPPAPLPLLSTPSQLPLPARATNDEVQLQYVASPDRTTLTKYFDDLALQACPQLASPEFSTRK